MNLSREELETISDLMTEGSQKDKLYETIYNNDPEFLGWAIEKANIVIMNICESAKLTHKSGQVLTQTVFEAFIMGYITHHLDILEADSDQKFKRWLEGRMPDKYYKTPFDDLDKESTVFEAREAHLNQKRAHKGISLALKDMFKSMKKAIIR